MGHITVQDNSRPFLPTSAGHGGLHGKRFKVWLYFGRRRRTARKVQYACCVSARHATRLNFPTAPYSKQQKFVLFNFYSSRPQQTKMVVPYFQSFSPP